MYTGNAPREYSSVWRIGLGSSIPIYLVTCKSYKSSIVWSPFRRWFFSKATQLRFTAFSANYHGLKVLPAFIKCIYCSVFIKLSQQTDGSYTVDGKGTVFIWLSTTSVTQFPRMIVQTVHVYTKQNCITIMIPHGAKYVPSVKLQTYFLLCGKLE